MRSHASELLARSLNGRGLDDALGAEDPAVLQGGYDTATAGRNVTSFWSTIAPQERIDAALATGRQIQPQYDAEFLLGTTWVWHRVNRSPMCYGEGTDDLRDAHSKTLCEIDSRLVLAGEHCLHSPAWLEGSLLSAPDAIRRLDERENARDELSVLSGISAARCPCSRRQVG